MNITFKPHSKKDIPLRVEWLNDPVVNKYIGDHIRTTFAKQEKWFIEYQKLRKKKNKYFFTIYQNDNPIGLVGLSKINYKTKNADFFLMIGESNLHGKGIGKIAAKFMIDYGFDKLKLHRISLSVIQSNQIAINCYKSAGFEIEGILKDDTIVNGKHENMVLMGIVN